MSPQFEITDQDSGIGRYVVSAIAPAVFLGSLGHQLKHYKMALGILDRLVARTNPSQPSFYAIHIKEVRNIA
jgi:hypothetical protein